MKVNSIACNNYGGSYIHLAGDGASVTITLTEEDSDRLRAVALDIFFKRQASIAKGIADIKPDLLPSPDVQDGEFTEVNDVP